MGSIHNNSGISKELRGLLSDIDDHKGHGLSFSLSNGRVKITHDDKPFLLGISMRPNARALRNARSKVMGFLKSSSAVSEASAPERDIELPARHPERRHEGYAERYAHQEPQVTEDSPSEETFPDLDEADASAAETDHHQDPAEEANDMNAPNDAPAAPEDFIAESRDESFAAESVGIDLGEEAMAELSDEEGKISPIRSDAFATLSAMGDAEADLLENVMRNGLPEGTVRVTPDMLGATLMIFDGRITVVPDILVRLAGASAAAPAPVVPAQQGRERPPVRRADAVSRRLGQIEPSSASSAEVLTDALLEVFGKRPGEALRSRDIYALLPEHVRKRYTSAESCASSFNRPLRNLVEQGLVKVGTKMGREMTWVSA